MSYIKTRIKEIREQKIGSTTKRALIVEGKDDVDAFESFLNKARPDWEKHWVIAEAGKKSNVLDIIDQASNWIGVVDRDEWSEEKITLHKHNRIHNNLWVLPRYCIENYLIVPEELWQALSVKQQRKVGELADLNQALKMDLIRWRCHGVLWSVINPLWEGLRGIGFKEALLNPVIAINEAEIKQKLSEWHDFLEPDQIWQQYQITLRDVEKSTEEQQFKLHFHGKLFYEQVVHPLFNKLLGQKSAKDLQQQIFITLPVPDDLEPLWKKMKLVS